MNRPARYQCPNCKEYIRAMVKETRNEYNGVFRRRACEKCGVIIETLEKITDFHVVHEKNRRQ